NIYRTALMNAGSDGRTADQLASLLAGRDILLYDDTPVSDFVEEQLEKIAAFIPDASAQNEESEGQQCLNHLLSSGFDGYRFGERQNIAEIILQAFDGDGGSLKKLEAIGIKIVNPKTPLKRKVIVANQHAGLEQI